MQFAGSLHLQSTFVIQCVLFDVASVVLLTCGFVSSTGVASIGCFSGNSICGCRLSQVLRWSVSVSANFSVSGLLFFVFVVVVVCFSPCVFFVAVLVVLLTVVVSDLLLLSR